MAAFRPVPLLPTALAVLCLGCSSNPSGAKDYELPPTFLNAETLIGERTGGGAGYYTIQRAPDPTALTMTLQRFKGDPVRKTITAVQTELPDGTWPILQDLLDGRKDIGGRVSVSQGATGTFFAGYVQHGDQTVRIANAEALQVLSTLQKFIETRAGA